MPVSPPHSSEEGSPDVKDGGSSRRRGASRPDFKQLETFLLVAETRNFAEAARRLGVSQPAVSQTIARLEQIYGGDLFERRRGSPVALTPIGRAILPKAKLLLFTVDQQIERAIATSRSHSGSLTIGFHPALAYGPVGDSITEISNTKPGVALRFVEGSPGELYRQLNERSLDIIFSPLHPEIRESANIQERLWREPLVVALPEHHALANAPCLRWSDLSTVPLMLKSNQGDLTDFRALAARMGDRRFDCYLHDVSRGTLVEFVRRGVGATLLLASAALPCPGVRHIPIEEENAALWVETLWPRRDSNPLRHHLLAAVRRHAQRRDFFSA
jgi:LysR family hydrogen peroxide-inducible transcriptional activator